MTLSPLRIWIDRCEHLAESVLRSQDLETALNRELTRPYSIGAPLLLHTLQRTGPVPCVVVDQALRYPDLALWWSVVDSDQAKLCPTVRPTDGPLFELDAFSAIEVWTETELAALHVLVHFGSEYKERVRSAVAWHLEHTQPDNATNRPWAVHEFVRFHTPESDHFAQTLVSNCCVQNGQPDVLSACILRDSAAILTVHAAQLVGDESLSE